ncbi:MAG: MFS transporter [Limisphaerales bacterium]
MPSSEQPAAAAPGDIAIAPTGVGGLSARQWKSGIAAWLGWFFDGLDMHLYTLVAAPFVAHLINVESTADPLVKKYSAWIQAAFLIGWAFGGGFFGRLGDKLGRSRALSLTILTYAVFTGVSFFAHTWWQLLIFRFVSALGIGGEWAVGASLLSETWPKQWRPWIAAVLQTGVNVGILCACYVVYKLAGQPERYVFLIGVLPALIVFWIRRNVPEPDEWREANLKAQHKPKVRELFKGEIVKTTLLTIAVCSFTLTGWWAFMFWHPQHLRNLPQLANWSALEKQQFISKIFFLVVGISIFGNYFSSWVATFIGYRRTIFLSCIAFVFAFWQAFRIPRGPEELQIYLPIIGFCSGMFGLFTMYMPPLFPTLLRTTGAGFCYNIGRIAAGIGTVVFGLYSPVGDFRIALLAIGGLFAVAAIVSWFLPELAKGE